MLGELRHPLLHQQRRHHDELVAHLGTRLTTPSSIILLSTALKNLDFVSSLGPSSSALNF